MFVIRISWQGRCDTQTAGNTLSGLADIAVLYLSLRKKTRKNNNCIFILFRFISPQNYNFVDLFGHR